MIGALFFGPDLFAGLLPLLVALGCLVAWIYLIFLATKATQALQQAALGIAKLTQTVDHIRTTLNSEQKKP